MGHVQGATNNFHFSSFMFTFLHSKHAVQGYNALAAVGQCFGDEVYSWSAGLIRASYL